jgi:hypothetical protein
MKVLKDNGLTIVLLLATVSKLIGMLVTDLSVYNEELAEHNAQAVSWGEYVTTGQFPSALFEAWESEFLQMSAYVVLTAFLFQPRSLYSYSLGLVLFLLFLVGFLVLLREAEALLYGQAAPTIADHLLSARTWFESFENWQSEFLSTALILILSIFLRFRDSPEFKPLSAPHSEAGA